MYSISLIVVNHSKARLRYRLQGYERYRILNINGRWGNNTSWLREGSTFHFNPTFTLAQSPQRIFPTEIYDSDFLSLPLKDRLRSWPTCWSMHAYYLFIRLIVDVNLVWFWLETEQKTWIRLSNNIFMYNSASLQKCRKMLKVCNCWNICSERDPTKFDLLAEYRCFSVLVLTRKILCLMIKWPNSMVYSCRKSMNELGSDSKIFRGL